VSLWEDFGRWPLRTPTGGPMEQSGEGGGALRACGRADGAEQSGEGGAGLRACERADGAERGGRGRPAGGLQQVASEIQKSYRDSPSRLLACEERRKGALRVS
jgi:hypothetical protein